MCILTHFWPFLSSVLKLYKLLEVYQGCYQNGTIIEPLSTQNSENTVQKHAARLESNCEDDISVDEHFFRIVAAQFADRGEVAQCGFTHL